jgi:hypothetical protein
MPVCISACMLRVNVGWGTVCQSNCFLQVSAEAAVVAAACVAAMAAKAAAVAKGGRSSAATSLTTAAAYACVKGSYSVCLPRQNEVQRPSVSAASAMTAQLP